MDTADFFGNRISRLIIGDNPMNGYSYIEDVTPGSEMKAFYTTERILEALFEMERAGFRTMLPLADPRMIRILQEYRASGGRIQFIFQPYMAMDQDESMRLMMSVEPIGIYHQGTTTDNLFESGRPEEIRAMIRRYRQMGIPVGLGTHRPDVIETSEREGWDVDFYVACLQNARLARTSAKGSYVTGETKMKLLFYPEDRAVMLSVLKTISKPVIAYKIFAGGQMFLGKSEEEKRALIKGAYEEVFSQLKENDAAAIGVFQRDKNEILEDAKLYEEWCAVTCGSAVGCNAR